jgi:hypothetical protein
MFADTDHPSNLSSCAGKGLALDTAWVAMVTMVSLFDIVKPKGQDINIKVMPGAARYGYFVLAASRFSNSFV